MAPGLPDLNKMSVAKLQGHSSTLILGLALALTVLLPGPTAIAQASSSGRPPHRTTHNYRPRSLDDRVKTLAKNLNLSKAQQASVKKILKERVQEILRLRTDPSLSGADRIARFRGLQKQTVVKIREVLDEEQKKKYDPLAPRKLPQAPQQRSVEDWIKATQHKKSK